MHSQVKDFIYSKIDLERRKLIKFNNQEILESPVMVNNHVKSINSLIVTGSIVYDDKKDVLRINLDSKNKMTVYCSISHDEMEYNSDVEISEEFSFDEKISNEWKISFLKNNTLDLTNSLINYIILNVPMKFIKESTNFVKAGENWEILNESEFSEKKIAETEQEDDPRWNDLRKLEKQFKEK